MTISFQQIRDGSIRIFTSRRSYELSQEEFVEAFGQPVPELVPPINQRVYEPGIRHPLSIDNDVMDGGPMPWPEGDEIIARADAMMMARRPLPEELAAETALANAKAQQEEEARLKAYVAAIRKEEDDRLAVYMARRLKGIEIIMSILKRAGGTDEELSQLVDGLWPPPGTRAPPQ